MRIPVFVSCPTSLSPAQEHARALILRQLGKYQLEPRALGRSDYPTESPLREVLVERQGDLDRAYVRGTLAKIGE